MNDRKPFKCKRCHREVAQTDGESIYFGQKPVPMHPTRIMFTCPYCLCEIKWQATTYRKQLQKVPTNGTV